MTVEEKEPELSLEKIGFLRRAYSRPVAGRVLDAIASFQKSAETLAKEEKEEEK